MRCTGVDRPRSACGTRLRRSIGTGQNIMSLFSSTPSLAMVDRSNRSRSSAHAAPAAPADAGRIRTPNRKRKARIHSSCAVRLRTRRLQRSTILQPRREPDGISISCGKVYSARGGCSASRSANSVVGTVGRGRRPATAAAAHLERHSAAGGRMRALAVRSALLLRQPMALTHSLTHSLAGRPRPTVLRAVNLTHRCDRFVLKRCTRTCGPQR